MTMCIVRELQELSQNQPAKLTGIHRCSRPLNSLNRVELTL